MIRSAVADGLIWGSYCAAVSLKAAASCGLASEVWRDQMPIQCGLGEMLIQSAIVVGANRSRVSPFIALINDLNASLIN
jgi:hypothetical protein